MFTARARARIIIILMFSRRALRLLFRGGESSGGRLTRETRGDKKSDRAGDCFAACPRAQTDGMERVQPMKYYVGEGWWGRGESDDNAGGGAVCDRLHYDGEIPLRRRRLRHHVTSFTGCRTR